MPHDPDVCFMILAGAVVLGIFVLIASVCVWFICIILTERRESRNYWARTYHQGDQSS